MYTSKFMLEYARSWSAQTACGELSYMPNEQPLSPEVYRGVGWAANQTSPGS